MGTPLHPLRTLFHILHAHAHVHVHVHVHTHVIHTPCKVLAFGPIGSADADADADTMSDGVADPPGSQRNRVSRAAAPPE